MNEEQRENIRTVEWWNKRSTLSGESRKEYSKKFKMNPEGWIVIFHTETGMACIPGTENQTPV